MDKVPMTKRGYGLLQEEMKHLKSVERPAVINALEEARTHGDLAETAEYPAPKERQTFIEGRLMELEDKISRAQVIDPTTMKGNIVRFGATVTLADEDTDKESTYQIVGEDEGDIQNGLLSLTAPLARAMIGKETGDSIEVTAPGGSKAYEIMKVKYK
ncbi:MAG: transcription elongation factor GreA [Rhodospirillaceae bacterium]|nr:transcription elongation factor GreA [Rhodospirillaceae bacterium]